MVRGRCGRGRVQEDEDGVGEGGVVVSLRVGGGLLVKLEGGVSVVVRSEGR